MSEERRGRRRLSSSGRRSETRKGPVVLPALPTLSGFSEAAHQQFSLPQKHKTQAIKGPRRATPTHKPSDKDVRKQIKVFSNKDDWTEVTATFVDDLVEAWISKDVFEHLELDAFPGTPGDPEWGVLGMKSVPLGGTTDLQWFPKDCKKVKDTRCRIVESKDFEVYLQSHLLPSNGSSGSKSSSVEIPSSPKLIPEPPASPLRKLAMVDSPPVQKDPLDTDTATLKEDIDRVSGIVPKGSFDGLPETISETSVEAKHADNWMAYLKHSFHDRFEKKPEIVHDPVKIAVLDTGLDITENSIKGALRQKRVKLVKSFIPGDPSISDEYGHGTHVASLLLKVAPHAQVFVLKIAKTEEILSTEIIAEAINHAANELRVDIITMSFGLDKENAVVQAAIRNAFSKNILMFAAASNSGGNLEVKYPARKDEVTCVYATDGSGNPFDKNPNTMTSSSFHFASLGVGVKSSWPRDLQNPPLKAGEPSERRQTGTSFATPIVAGIAACIIEFAIVHNLSEDLLGVLKTRQGMQKTLSKFMVDETPRSGLHYIHPWKMFTNDRDDEVIVHMMTDILKC